MPKTHVNLCWVALVGCSLVPDLMAQTSGGGLVSSYRISPTPMRPSRAYGLTVETAPAVNQVTALVDFRPYTSLRARLVLTYDPTAGAWRASGVAPGGFPVPPGATVLVSAYASTATGLRQTVAWRHPLALNAAPTAAAGPDFSAARGAAVVLDGSGSSDSDGDPLTYEWSFLSRPAGSGANLSDTTAVKPGFTLDVSGTYTLLLRVNDGLAQSAPDTIEISTLNSTPAAHAGPDQSAPVGTTVVLDGSQSSDADGDQLDYAWSLLSQPAASTAQLSDPTAVKPSLPLDAPGGYVLQLLVSDGFTTSGPDTVTISTYNSPPVAHAGPDQAARVGDTVTLDASLSSDVDGDQLARAWSFLSRPAGSAAALSDPVALKPVFLLDVAGTYVVQLIVSDGQEAGAPDTLTVSTLNSRPLANAGPDQTTRIGQSVQLDGAASTDADQNPLEYAWSFAARPSDSATALSDPAVANPIFQVDRPGQYVLQLVVTDGQEASGPDTVTISTVNSKPAAHAGPDQSVAVGAPVTLDGTASTDADGDPLHFFWAFTTRPDNSASQLTDPLLPNPAFVADQAGDYVVQLIVGDGQENSDPDTLTVTAAEQLVTVPNLIGQPQAAAEAALQALALGASSGQSLSDLFPAGQVISQDPAAGTQVSPGTVVALVVSLGAAPTTLTLTPETAQAFIGGSVALTVTLDRPAPAVGTVVQLSTDSALVSLPSSIAVAPGQMMQTFTVTAGALAGTANVTASAPSLSPDTAQVTVVDNVPPTVTLALEAASDTAPVGDDMTEVNPVTFTGQTEPGLAVVLREGDAGGTTVRTTVADAGGRFSFPQILLLPGPNRFTAFAEDLAGNVGAAARSVVLELCPLASPSDWTITITPPTPLVTSPIPGSATVADCGATLTEGDSFLVSLARAFTLRDGPTHQNALRLILQNDGPSFDASTPNAIRDAFELAVVDAAGQPLTYTVGGSTSTDACANLTDGQSPGLAAGVTVTPSSTGPGQSEILVNLAHLFPGQSLKVILRLVNNDRDRLTTVRVADLRLAFVEGLGTVLAPPSDAPPANPPTPGLTLPGSVLGNLSFDSPTAPAGPSTPPGGNAAPEDPLGPALSLTAPVDGTELPAGTSVLLSGSAIARALLDPQADPGVFVRFDGFAQPEGLTLNGQAQVTTTPDGPVLRLTPAVAGASGSAFSSTKVNAASFSSFFAFRITEPGGISQAGRPGLLREVYADIPGFAITDLTSAPTFPDHPTSVELLTTAFEAPTGVGDNYGQRIRGYVIPPLTGNYTFWIASDDAGQLFLSPDDQPAHKQMIAQVNLWTLAREWTKEPNQQSACIPMVAGQRYYIEALMKDGGGGDHLAVRWQLPDGSIEEPIPVGSLAADTTPPFATAGALLHPDGVTVDIGIGFDELVDAAAADPANYSVSSGTVADVQWLPESRSVRVQVTGFSGDTGTVTLRNVGDAHGNRIGETNLTFAVPSPLRWGIVGASELGLESGVVPVGEGDFNAYSGGIAQWTTDDEATFVYEPIIGDFDKKVRVEFQEASSRWARAGLSVRETLNFGVDRITQTGGTASRYLDCHVTPLRTADCGAASNAYEVNGRSTAGAAAIQFATSAGPAYPNAWCRLQRQDQILRAYRSDDGVNWTLITEVTAGTPLPERLYVGAEYCPEIANIADPAARRTFFAQFREYSDTAVAPRAPTARPMAARLMAPEPGADGLVFVVQSVSSSIGGIGGGIGYAGIPDSVGVEFDTWWNPENNDPDANHLGIDTGGDVNHGSPALFARSIAPNFDDGRLWYAWVDYDGTTLEVRANQTGVRPEQPTLERAIDIPAALRSTDAFVGFTSGTGGAWANHDIVYWQHNDTYRPVDGTAAHRILSVTVNGLPVESLDAIGNFFTTVSVAPGQNQLTVVALDNDGRSNSRILTVNGTQAAPGGVETTRLVDVTGSALGEYGRTTFNDRSRVLSTELALRNAGQYPFRPPLLVGITRLSDPSVRVVQADGLTADGVAVFQFTPPTSGALAPTELSLARTLSFSNPNRVQFTYELAVLGNVNQAPVITSRPDVEALTDKPYTYTLTATDPDGDPLAFTMVMGPTGASFTSSDSTPGVATLSWAPGIADIGTREVLLRVTDGNGGSAEQRFVLSVVIPVLNRPPVFRSLPIVSARLGSIYQYDAEAIDADGDVLSYTLDRGPAGMQVDPETGVVQWTPSVAAALGDGLSYRPLDSSASFNANLADVTYGSAFPVGPVLANGIPFHIPTSGNNIWHSLNQAGPNPRVLELTADQPGAVEVHTLINTWWGAPGPNSYASVECFGSEGAYFRKDLIGNSDIRDFLQNTYNNSINGDTTQTAFTAVGQVTVVGWTTRLDHQTFTLPPEFATQRLTTIRITDNGADGVQRLFVAGVTVGAAAQLGGQPVTLQATDPQGARVQQSFVIQLLPDPANHAPVIVSRPVTTVSTLDYPLGGSRAYTYQVAAMDPDADPLTYQLVAGPGLATLDPATGLLTWVPTATEQSFRIRAADNRGGFDEQAFALKLEPPGTGQIAGTVFDDRNGDGARAGDGSEPVLTNWRVLLDLNFNQRADDGESSTLTDANGAYAFSNLKAGTYRPRLEFRAGWAVTAPNVPYALTLADGQQLTATDFGTRQPPVVPANRPPAFITNPSSGASTAGQTFRYDAQAVDPDAEPVHYDLSLSPQGMVVDPNVGAVVWIPSTAQVGTHSVVLRAQDGRGGVVLQSFEVIVARPNTGPDITSTPHVPALVGVPYQYQVTAQDADGDPLSYSLVQGPVDMTIDPVTGLLGWLPSQGSSVVAFSADFENGVPAPFAGPGTLAGVQGYAGLGDSQNRFAGSFLRNASGGSPPGTPSQRLMLSLRDLPPHTSLDVRFLLAIIDSWDGAGTIAGAAPERLRVRVDGQEVFSESFLNADVPNPPDRLEGYVPAPGVLLALRQPLGFSGSASYFMDSAYDMAREPRFRGIPHTASTVTVEWFVEGAGWQGGDDESFALDNVQIVLRGATTLNAMRVAVQAADGRGGLATQSFDLPIEQPTAPNQAPVIASSPRTSLRLGLGYAYQVRAVDPDNDPLTFNLTTAPEGMTLALVPGADPNVRQLLWEPTSAQVGANLVRLEVDDGRGGTVWQEWSVAITVDPPTAARPVNGAPVITSTPGLAARLGVVYAYEAVATDPDGDPLVWSLDAAPSGLSVDPTRGTLRWKPAVDQLGFQEVALRAQDPFGGSTLQTFTLTVSAFNLPPQITSQPPVGAQNEKWVYAVRADDPEKEPLVFSLTTAPPGMTIDPVTGLLQWVFPTVEERQTNTVVITVTDPAGATARQEFKMVNWTTTESPTSPVDIPATGRPVFLSQPDLVAVVGQDYEYRIRVVDPDRDPVILVVFGPDYMTLVNGVVHWRPSGPGYAEVTIWASDSPWGTAVQSFTIQVRSDNRPPTITSTPATETDAGIPYRYDVQATDPDGGTFTYAVLGPPGMTIDAAGRVQWVPPVPITGTVRVRVSAFDPLGARADQEFDLFVRADTQAPQVQFEISPNPVPVGETVVFSVQATDNVKIASRSLTLDGVPVVLDANGRATGALTTTGTHLAVATAADVAGNRLVVTKSLEVVPYSSGGSGSGDPSDPDAPLALITSPEDDAVVTSRVEVRGTASDANLEYYTLAIGPSEGGEFTEIAHGTASVTDGVLGLLDPTLLPNDSYILRLTVVETAGRSTEYERIVHASGELKLGNFRLSFTDLSLPVSGIPITVGRTYDSLNAGTQGDFGYGWRLEFKNTHLRASVPKSAFQDGLLYNPFRNKSRVNITLPGGRRVGFTFKPTQSVVGFLRLQFPEFVPDPGVHDQLTVGRYPIFYEIASGAYLDFTLGTPYNPASPFYDDGIYTLTTREGVTMQIDGNTGDLRSLTDRNHNVLTFTQDGIQSSTGVQITFTRDPQGRIIGVTDPMGHSIRYAYDAHGDLISVTDRTANTTRLVYGTPRPHYLSEIIDPLGNPGIRTEYDDTGRLVTLRDAQGNPVHLDHDLDANTERVTDPLGNVSTYQYDSQGNVTNEVNAVGAATRRTYDANNNLTSETDALGNASNFEYDSRGNETRRTDPLGNVTQSTYNTFGQVTRTVDPLGHVTSSEYDGGGNLTSSLDAAGNATRYSYDPAGNPSQSTDALGHVTHFEYDGTGRLLKQTDALGNATSFTYDSLGNQTSQTTLVTVRPGDVRTNTTITAYDANGRPTTVTDAAGNTTQTEYDALGKTRATVDALGHRTEMEYDERGQLSATVFPDGTRSTVTYDLAGRRTSSTDRAGRMTRHEYDAQGRLVSTIHPDHTPADPADNPRTRTFHDLAGRTIATTDERGHSTWFGYDAAGRQISVTNALGGVTGSAYDAAGRKIAETDALGHTTRFVHDAVGRRTQILFADGTSKRTEYDALGRVVAEVDQAGVTTRFEHDALGRLQAVVDALGQRTEYGYNETGNLVRQQDANGHVTRYEFETCCQRSATILPLGQRSTTVFNAVNSVAAITNFNGQVIQFAYDVNNRLATKMLPGGAAIEYTYTPTGRRETITDAHGVTRFVYDARERLLARIDPNNLAVAYTYDDVGNRTAVLTGFPRPLGGGEGPGEGALLSVTNSITRYSFDALGRLETVTDPDGGVTAYAYDAVNNPVLVTLPNGTTRSATFDELNRPRTIEHRNPAEVIASYQYTLGPTGNRVAVQEHIGRTVQYVYDQLYRLTRESITDPVSGSRTIEYTLDPVGNRLSRSDSGEGQTDYTYDANDQLLTETLAGATTTYTYDDNGNTLSRVSPTEGALYQWSPENRLVAATVTGTDGVTRDLGYAYDDDGIRVASSVTEAGAITATAYLIDANRPYAQVLEEWTSRNGQPAALAAAYTYGPHHPISQHRAGVRAYYHADGLGSTRALTSQTGNLTDDYHFDAYGRTLRQTGSHENSYLFAGEQRDTLLGLDYLRARYLGVAVGRFAGRDRAEGTAIRPQSLHRYAFVEGDPVNRTDPSGQFALGAALAASVSGMEIVTMSVPILVKGAAIASQLRFFYEPSFRTRDVGLLMIASGDDEGFEVYRRGNQMIGLATRVTGLTVDLLDWMETGLTAVKVVQAFRYPKHTGTYTETVTVRIDFRKLFEDAGRVEKATERYIKVLRIPQEEILDYTELWTTLMMEAAKVVGEKTGETVATD